MSEIHTAVLQIVSLLCNVLVIAFISYRLGVKHGEAKVKDRS